MRPGFDLDHVGIATPSIEESLKFYRSLGWVYFSQETVISEKVNVAFIEFENSVNVELLEPLSEDSVIAKFLQKRGAGVHHLCYRVKDLEKVLESLRAEGVKLIDQTPRPGAHGCKVAFIHPSAAGGVLVELSQKQQLSAQKEG